MSAERPRGEPEPAPGDPERDPEREPGERPLREGGPTELVPTEEGGVVERLSAGTATLLLVWLIGVGAGSTLLALWVFVAIVIGQRLGIGDLFSGLGFYVAIFGASGPVVLWLAGRAQGHSLGWFVVTSLKIAGVMLAIVVAFGAIAALLAGPGIGVGGLISAALVGIALAVLSVIWAVATWSADWYIAHARAASE